MSLTISAAPKLIQFAGDDQPPRDRKFLTADTLFAMGYDTMQIAEYLDISEAQVLRRISVARSRRLGRANPYEARK